MRTRADPAPNAGMRTIGVQCPTCGVWFLFAERERAHHEAAHVGPVMAEAAVKRAAWQDHRRRWRVENPIVGVESDTFTLES